MKRIILAICISFSLSGYCQIKVDTSNYYEYYSNGQNLKDKKVKTAWLTEIEVTEILFEEMNKAGFDEIQRFFLVELNEKQFIKSICYSRKSNFGFVYEGIHGIIGKQGDRHILSCYKKMTGSDYKESFINTKGQQDVFIIEALPKNILIIKSDLYWFQYTDNAEDNKKLVSKTDIINILRLDLRTSLSKFKT